MVEEAEIEPEDEERENRLIEAHVMEVRLHRSVTLPRRRDLIAVEIMSWR